jgi:hypothetical protein
MRNWIAVFGLSLAPVMASADTLKAFADAAEGYLDPGSSYCSYTVSTVATPRNASADDLKEIVKKEVAVNSHFNGKSLEFELRSLDPGKRSSARAYYELHEYSEPQTDPDKTDEEFRDEQAMHRAMRSAFFNWMEDQIGGKIISGKVLDKSGNTGANGKPLSAGILVLQSGRKAVLVVFGHNGC